MRYFHISTGLRGCYMPDSVHIYCVESRRELHEAITSEAESMRDAYNYGGSKKAVSAAVAQVWAGYKTQHLDSVIPFARERGDYAYGLFISPASRADYLAHVWGE